MVVGDMEALIVKGTEQALATPVDTETIREVASKPPPLKDVLAESKAASSVTLVQVVPEATPAPMLKPSFPVVSVTAAPPAATAYPPVPELN